MPDSDDMKSATSAHKPIWHTYRDKTGKVLSAEQFDGDWQFKAMPEMSGHAKLTAHLNTLKAKRTKKSK